MRTAIARFIATMHPSEYVNCLSRVRGDSLARFCGEGVIAISPPYPTTYESVPFIYSAGGLHPDHDSINSFRKRFLVQLEELFVRLLLIAHRLGVLKLGDIFIDGSKVKANASKHKALSW